jgi:hypothetical protein
MSVISLLQQIGENAHLMQASNDQLATFLEPAELSDVMKSALISGDHAKLINLLGASANIVCGLATPDQDDQEKEEDKDGEKDSPADDQKISLAA